MTSAILADALRAHVHELAGRIGARHAGRPSALAEARDYIRGRFSAYGYQPRLLPYDAPGGTCHNVEALLDGPEGAPMLVLGAHYDSVAGTPGADDNASGVAGLLECARLTRGLKPRTAVAFCAFSTEEAPHFGTGAMGSLNYAAGLRARGAPVAGMISLEMIGFYSKREGLQRYPPLLSRFFPKQADFIGLVGDLSSRAFLRRVRQALEPRLKIPLVCASLPRWVSGVSLSDHYAFWSQGFPAVMLTDTAFFRNANYHQASDEPVTLDYDSMAALVEGLAEAVAKLAS